VASQIDRRGESFDQFDEIFREAITEFRAGWFREIEA